LPLNVCKRHRGIPLKLLGHCRLKEAIKTFLRGHFALTLFRRLDHREQSLSRLFALDNRLDLLEGRVNTLHTNPPKGRLAVRGHMSLLDETDGLEHIRDVVQPANLCLEGLVIDGLIVSDLTSGFFE